MDHPNPYTITFLGILIVFTVLGLIAAAVALIGRLDDQWQNREAKEETAALAADPKIDHTSLVLITAAVATVGLGRTRIRSVRRLAPEQSAVWSAQGRAVLIGSHQISRHRS